MTICDEDAVFVQCSVFIQFNCFSVLKIDDDVKTFDGKIMLEHSLEVVFFAFFFHITPCGM